MYRNSHSQLCTKNCLATIVVFLLDASLYQCGGYLAAFYALAGGGGDDGEKSAGARRLLTSPESTLRSLSLSVDVMVESFVELRAAAPSALPSEDLRFAMEALSGRVAYEVFIQVRARFPRFWHETKK